MTNNSSQRTLVTAVVFASVFVVLVGWTPSAKVKGGRLATVTPLQVALTKPVFANGEQIRADVTSPADVLVASDLSRSSTQFAIFGTKTINLGPASSSGYNVISFDDGVNKTALQILLLAQAQGFEALSVGVPLKPSDLGSTVQIRPVIEKFLANVNASRVARAYAAAKTKFPSENAVALGNTVIICLITIPTGAWVACAGTVGGVAVDFMFKLNEELIDVLGPTKDVKLTAQEVSLLKLLIGTARIIPDALKLIFSANKVEKVLEALKVGKSVGELVVENNDGKFAFKTANDFLKKYEIIYKLK